MAKLDSETTEIVNRLKQESLDIVDDASALEFKIFERFGESEQTLLYMDEMKNVEEEASTLYSRLSTLHLQVARSQPIPASATLELLELAIQQTLARIPALERSIQEVKMEWNLS
jgi:hypothetical protein